MARSVLRVASLAALLLPPAPAAAIGRGRLAPAFVPSRRPRVRPAVLPAPRLALASAAVDDVPSDVEAAPAAESVLRARDDLLSLASSLASDSPSGVFLNRPSDKRELQKAIQKLEALAPATGEEERDLLLGDWTLVATASLPGSDIRRRLEKNEKKAAGWFENGKKSNGRSLNPFQKGLQKTFGVTQRIRNDGTSSNGSEEINRVDNVIEITPLDTLEDVLPRDFPLFDLLGKVDVNPLKVDKSKVVLVHKAEVESVSPVLRTRIAQVSTVLNVAGRSQFLTPEGEDVFGVNNLLGEFVGAGTFDTPFVDEEVRVSRTSGPISEQLRVFVRKGGAPSDAPTDGKIATEIVEEPAEGGSSTDDGARAKEVVDARENPAEDASDAAEKDAEGMAAALGGKLDDVAADLSKAVENKLDDMAANVQEGSDVGARVKTLLDATTSRAERVLQKDVDNVDTVVEDVLDDAAAKVQNAVEDDSKQIGKAVVEVGEAIQGEGNIGDAIANAAKAAAKAPGDVAGIVEGDRAELESELREALEEMVADVQGSVEEDLKDARKSVEGTGDGAEGDGEEEEEEEKKKEE